MFAAAAGPDPGAALSKARQALEGARDPLEGARDPLDGATEALRPPDPQPGREAIRDVLGWNTVWDRANRRAYTASTRAWIDPKFGGFGVWQIDGFLHAVLAAHLASLAGLGQYRRGAGRAVRPGEPGRPGGGTTYWQDRSHPPFGTMSVERAGKGSGRWQRRRAAECCGRVRLVVPTRDGNGNGLLEYGSSPVGDGHFVHTRQAAMDESANDNSPVHDDARFDPSTHTLDLEDVGLNSLLVHEGSLLTAQMPPGNDRLAGRAAELAEAVRTRLWDSGREVFAGRLWNGEFTRSLSPTSFYPLLAGIATPDQAEAMVQRWLTDPRRFGGRTRWPGRRTTIPPRRQRVLAGAGVALLQLPVYLGLRRYRFDEQAAWLASRGLEMFRRGWAERRCYENFSQQTGDGGDSVDAEPFYTWGSLLPMIADPEA